MPPQPTRNGEPPRNASTAGPSCPAQESGCGRAEDQRTAERRRMREYDTEQGARQCNTCHALRRLAPRIRFRELERALHALPTREHACREQALHVEAQAEG